MHGGLKTNNQSIMNTLLEGIRRLAVEYGLSRPHLLVAVSGGEDSHVLLQALLRLRKRLEEGTISSASAGFQGLSLTVAHFDHALREESAQDALFVRSLARRYELPFYFERASAKPHGLNVEAWARNVRYRFLEQVRQKVEADFILTAHHKNDQAETLLFRLFTGRILTDAQMIALVDPRRRLYRPLLFTSKEAIEDYAKRHRIDCVFDSSNADKSRTRNKIRLDLLPQLAKDYNPRLVSHVAEAAMRLGDDENFLEMSARDYFISHRGRFFREDFRRLPRALRWRVLGLLAERELGLEARKLGYFALQRVLDLVLAGGKESRFIELGFGFSCEVLADGELRFYSQGSPQAVLALPFLALEPSSLSIPGEVKRYYPDGVAEIAATVITVKERGREDIASFIDWTKSVACQAAASGRAVEYFDLERLALTKLQVRERKEGDKVRVFKRGRRKLKQLMLEHRIESELRNYLPVIEAGEQILWVPGVCRSELAPVDCDSRYLLELKYQRK